MQKPSVLLIDDSAMMRRFIALFLSEKYHVTDCESAEEALHLVESGFRPRLIVTDLDLPGMSGLELIRCFQATMPFTPLIVVSGAKESKTRLAALAAGADDFLTKPFHPAELLVRMGNLLRRDRDRQPALPGTVGFMGAIRRAAAMIF